MASETATRDIQLGQLYRSLPLHSEYSTRVLHLLPRTRGTSIHISLKVVNLALDPEYEALSYVWGTSAANRSVTVNGRYELPVTDNLFDALIGLRRSIRAGVLWIDQICINQADVEERGHQVTFMSRIFSNASCVNAWLGQPEGYVLPLSMEALPVALWRTMSQYRRTPNRLGAWDAVRNRHQSLEQCMENSIQQWMTRAWITQEIVLAKQVYLCCGPTRFLYNTQRFGQMGRLMDSGTDHRSRLFDFGLAFDRMSFLFDITLDSILARLNRPKEASDPRDMVYSFLGILSAAERAYISPDYRLTCAEVYANATYASIAASGGMFDVLRFVNIRPVTPEQTLPSWSVDFAYALKTEIKFNSMNAIPYDELPWSVYAGADNFRQLVMSARVLGEVVHSINLRCVPRDTYGDPPMEQDRLQEGWIQHFKELVKLAASIADSLSRGSSYSGIVEALRSRYPACDMHPYHLHDSAAAHEDFSAHGRMVDLLHIWDNRTRIGVLCGTEDGRGFERKFQLNALSEPIKKSRVELDYLIESAKTLSGTNSISAFVTEDGLIGLGPGGIERGYTIAQIASTYPWMALAPNGDYQRFGGLVWIHGLMEVDAIDAWRKSRPEERTYTLV